MGKILMLGQGSPSDPGYDIRIDNKPVKEYMAQRGIAVIDPTRPVIQSCHGCPELMHKYSGDMESLFKDGHRVAGVLNGGLYFALPSIQAAETTYPVISVPLDIPSFQAFIVPSGHAAVAGVGIEKKDITGEYQTRQREKALRIAADMLNLDEKGVAIRGNGDLGMLEEALDKYGVSVDPNSSLRITYCSPKDNLNLPPLQDYEEGIVNIVAFSNTSYTKCFSDLERLEGVVSGLNAVAVHGAKNSALVAAKALEMSKTIDDIAIEKEKSYEPRDLTQEAEEAMKALKGE